jgi:hypothetical protein
MAQIRGPGIQLPLDSPQNTGRPGVLVLPPGGIYTFTQGDYIVASGDQTVLQYFDPGLNAWRTFTNPGALTTFFADGGNFRLVNLSGVVVGGNITNAGSGGTNGIGFAQTGSTVTFAAPAAGGVTGTATGFVVVGGSVAAPTITQAGSGFLTPPVVFCDPPPQGGVQATAIAVISAAGAITGITMVNVGAGYTSAPQWYISPSNFNGFLATPDRAAGAFPQPGLINPANVWPGTVFQGNIALGTTGALLTPTALTGSGTLTAIVMSYYGAGYAGNTVPAISFGGTSLGAAAATAIMSLCVSGSSATATGGTTAVTGGVAITSLGLIALTNNNNTFWPRPARGTTSAAAGTFTVEDPGFGLQGGVVTVTYVGGATLATVTNTQLGGRNDTSIIQSSVNS